MAEQLKEKVAAQLRELESKKSEVSKQQTDLSQQLKDLEGERKGLYEKVRKEMKIEFEAN